MLKRILFLVILAGFITLPASAQSFYAEFSYQSFRPYINFRLELGNHHPQRLNPYEASYMKGYMDGVNATYYADYRFYEMVSYIDAYEAGYRDGLRDQRLMSRLQGYNRLPRRPFAYNDYYSPYYSVQIWLSQLTFTFIRAPERRLPRYWSHRVHPSVLKYRNRAKKKRFFSQFKHRYEKHTDRLRRSARKQYRHDRDDRTYRDRAQRGPNRINRERAMQRVRRGESGQRTLQNGRSGQQERLRRVRSSRSGTVGERASRSSGRRVEKSKGRSGSRQEVRSRSRSGNRGKGAGTKVKRSRGNNGSKGNSRSRSGRSNSRRGGRGNN